MKLDTAFKHHPHPSNFRSVFGNAGLITLEGRSFKSHLFYPAETIVENQFYELFWIVGDRNLQS
jgi:hypothetical protein